MFNLLTDVPPETVNVEGIEYAINSGASVMIKIALLIEEGMAADDQERSRLLIEELRLFYRDLPRDLTAATETMLEFYSFSSDSRAASKPKTKQDRLRVKMPPYSFAYDAGLIYAAFAQQYPGRDMARLHWFEFRALMAGLTEETLFQQVVGFRTMEIPESMSKEQKKYYRRMKRLYALPDKRSAGEKDQDFAAALSQL